MSTLNSYHSGSLCFVSRHLSKTDPLPCAFFHINAGALARSASLWLPQAWAATPTLLMATVPAPTTWCLVSSPVVCVMFVCTALEGCLSKRISSMRQSWKQQLRQVAKLHHTLFATFLTLQAPAQSRASVHPPWKEPAL